MIAPSSTNGDPSYDVEISGAIAEDIRWLATLAKRQGRGPAFVAALRTVLSRLRRDPKHFGEPLYRLTTLKLAIRCAAVRPLAIDFAVSEDDRVVYIKAVKLLR